MRGRAPLVAVALALLAGLACDVLPGRPRPEDRPRPPSEVKSFDALYGTRCAGCHGADGRLGPARPLADAVYLAIVSDETLTKVTAEGVPGSLMPAFASSAGGPLSDEQVRILVHGMRQRWGRPAAFASVSLPAYAPPEGAAPGDARAGRRIYAAHCADCHGPDGTGGPHGGSIVDPHYLALVSDQALRTAVIAGRTDLGMPDWRGRPGASPLGEPDIADVVAWLVSLRPQRGQEPAPNTERRARDE